MAKLTLANTGNSADIKENDNKDLINKAEELGILLGCNDGRCGSCRCEVLEGMENLNSRTKNEEDIGIEEPYRLICQCEMNGNVKIKMQ